MDLCIQPLIDRWTIKKRGDMGGSAVGLLPLFIICTPASAWNMCACVPSLISTKDYSSWFRWLTPSTTEMKQIVLVTQLESEATCAGRWASSTSRNRQSKNHSVLSGEGASARDRCGAKWQSDLCSRLQLQAADLQSYQVGGCWRCSIWSLLALLWRRTALDHWRWWGGLGVWDSTYRHKEALNIPITSQCCYNHE